MASKATTRDSRTRRPPVARLARSSSSASSTPGMVRTPSTVLTTRTAPGRETRWPGGGGYRLLWPQRPTGTAGGGGITAAVPGRHRQLLLHKSKQPTSGPRLCTADCSLIACLGVRKMHVAASGRRFTWDFYPS